MKKVQILRQMSGGFCLAGRGSEGRDLDSPFKKYGNRAIISRIYSRQEMIRWMHIQDLQKYMIRLWTMYHMKNGQNTMQGF